MVFTFTLGRLGIFFAIFFGVPLFVFLLIRFAEWAEEHITIEIAGGCLLILVMVLLGILAGYLAFFSQ